MEAKIAAKKAENEARKDKAEKNVGRAKGLATLINPEEIVIEEYV